MRTGLAHVALVAAHAFREVHRTRALLAAVLAGLVVCCVTVLATKLSFGAARKVSLDVSLGLVSIWVKVAALAYGMNLVSREVERRTLHAVLSRSVSRASFLVGRSLGLLGVLVAGALAVSALGLLSFLFFGGAPAPGVALCVAALLVEGCLVMGLGVFLSLVVGRALVVLAVVSLYFASHFIPEVQGSAFVVQGGALDRLLAVLEHAVPQFHRLNVKDLVLYEDRVEGPPVAAALLHSATYVALLGAASVAVFRRKDLG